MQILASHILPKPAYCIFFRIWWHFQKCICKNYATYAKICTYTAYARAFFNIFLVQRCFKTAKYFDDKQLPVFAIRRWI